MLLKHRRKMGICKFWMYIVITIIGLICTYYGYETGRSILLLPGLTILMSLVAAYFYEFFKNEEENKKKDK